MGSNSSFLKRVVDMVIRNRIKIFDLGFILILLGVAALFIFEIDVFKNEAGLTQRQETVELDELLVFTTLLMMAVLFYTWRRAREHARENARRIEAEREVLSLAMQDPLTGLPNRRQFDDALKAALACAPTAPEAHAVLLLDLNGFKKINDVHGHPVGDQVLIHVGARLLRAVREGDLVARLGGDEFAVLARNVAGPEAATNIALRIIEGLTTPIAAGGGRHNIGTAIGVALTPQDGDTGEEILRKADVALYRAKAERASTVRFFEDEMDARLKEREALEIALREAVEDNALLVRFQPAIDARSGRVTAFEALARWPHPSLGELGPDRFIPIAEEIGLVSLLTQQLFIKACTAAATWPDQVRLSFNVTAVQLKEPTFGLWLLSVLTATKVAPTRLDLEIDEGALIRDTIATQAVLEPLRQAGVSVVADHFGTGYSDLQNLHRLRLDRIKIDPTFVAAMIHDRQAATMVRALIGIGQSMDIPVTADGVFSQEQQAALAEQGCHDVQGHLYSEPVDEAAAMTLAKASGPASRQRYAS